MALGFSGSIADEANAAVVAAINAAAQTNAGSNAKNSNGKKFDGRLNGGFDLNAAKRAKAADDIPNIHALGAGDAVGSGIEALINDIKDITNKDNNENNINDPGNKKLRYGSGSGSGSNLISDEEDPYERVMRLISETADKNNAWNAEQAKIDRDWQKMMSDTAHQREVKDLQAAGLNPVLSAGGNGASTPSGAQAQADTSNTRLLAEVAMTSIEAMAQTASGFARASKKADNNNESLNFLQRFSNSYKSNPLVKKGVDTALNMASSVARLGIVKALF